MWPDRITGGLGSMISSVIGAGFSFLILIPPDDSFS